MESIEPYDYSQLEEFDMAYLSGYFADKYDIPSENGEERIRRRVGQTMADQLQSTVIGYASVVPTSRQMNIRNSKARYVLLPVWTLNTRYKDKLYTFAMNGQTGKFVGDLPMDKGIYKKWLFGITAAVSAVAFGLSYLFWLL